MHVYIRIYAFIFLQCPGKLHTLNGSTTTHMVVILTVFDNVKKQVCSKPTTKMHMINCQQNILENVSKHMLRKCLLNIAKVVNKHFPSKNVSGMVADKISIR